MPRSPTCLIILALVLVIGAETPVTGFSTGALATADPLSAPAAAPALPVVPFSLTDGYAVFVTDLCTERSGFLAIAAEEKPGEAGNGSLRAIRSSLTALPAFAIVDDERGLCCACGDPVSATGLSCAVFYNRDGTGACCCMAEISPSGEVKCWCKQTGCWGSASIPGPTEGDDPR